MNLRGFRSHDGDPIHVIVLIILEYYGDPIVLNKNKFYQMMSIVAFLQNSINQKK